MLTLPHPLTNFEIQGYYQNEPRFNGVFSRDNLPNTIDLSNYATKKDIKDITHIDASGFALKTNLAALKTGVDKIDTDKLKTVPIDLAKLTNVVKNEVLKKMILMLMITSKGLNLLQMQMH